MIMTPKMWAVLQQIKTLDLRYARGEPVNQYERDALSKQFDRLSRRQKIGLRLVVNDGSHLPMTYTPPTLPQPVK